MKVEGVSRREAARRCGVDEATIRRHVDNGGLAKAVLPDGRLDAAKVMRILPTLLTSGRRVPAALTSARARRLRALVRGLEDEVAGLRAAYLPPDAIGTLRAPSLVVAAQHISRIPDDAAQRVASQPGDVATRELDDVINGTLARLQKESSLCHRPLPGTAMIPMMAP